MTQSVQIGDNNYPIQRFRGLKAILAVAAVTRIAREVPDIMADTARAYQGRNTVVITEAMSRLPRWSSFTKEDFDAAQESSGRREIEIPAPMSNNEQLLQALPRLLEEARTEVFRLLAILLIPNDQLKQADKDDKVEDALDQFGDILLYDAELDQLAELALVASDVLSDQLADRKDRLGKLLGPLMRRFLPTQALPSSTPAPTSETNSTSSPTTEKTSMSPTSPGNAPSLSTDSPVVMAGTETPSSTESLGVSS